MIFLIILAVIVVAGVIGYKVFKSKSVKLRKINSECPHCKAEYDFDQDIEWEEYRRTKERLTGGHFVEFAYIRGEKKCSKCNHVVKFNAKISLLQEDGFDVHNAIARRWNEKIKIFATAQNSAKIEGRRIGTRF